jgi:serine/threonine protein phosphatase 1
MKTPLPHRALPHATPLAKALCASYARGMNAVATSFAPPAPDRPFVALGDVHGRLDLLEPLLAKAQSMRLPVVMLGDYIDRGPQSAGVLALLRAASTEMDLTCLRGNHEELLLRFLHRPRRTGRPWLRYGGRETLASFGLDHLPQDVTAADLIQARATLIDALGDTVDWLKSLPYLWQSGNIAACHAGADPAQPFDSQPQKPLAWGHPDFGQIARTDGIWCIHGHRIVPDVTIRDGVISIDTGAWQTGRLSAVLIGDGPLRLL